MKCMLRHAFVNATRPGLTLSLCSCFTRVPGCDPAQSLGIFVLSVREECSVCVAEGKRDTVTRSTVNHLKPQERVSSDHSNHIPYTTTR